MTCANSRRPGQDSLVNMRYDSSKAGCSSIQDASKNHRVFFVLVLAKYHKLTRFLQHMLLSFAAQLIRREKECEQMNREFAVGAEWLIGNVQMRETLPRRKASGMVKRSLSWLVATEFYHQHDLDDFIKQIPEQHLDHCKLPDSPKGINMGNVPGYCKPGFYFNSRTSSRRLQFFTRTPDPKSSVWKHLICITFSIMAESEHQNLKGQSNRNHASKA
ncbi:hypothetical protein U0070_017636 [Myodes glareolus]|uniref:Uncharacterized protein n=1 Tax=Myodes glareolus TaxID=447135 RepID=A0AAW0K6V7_MYOGA